MLIYKMAARKLWIQFLYFIQLQRVDGTHVENTTWLYFENKTIFAIIFQEYQSIEYTWQLCSPVRFFFWRLTVEHFFQVVIWQIRNTLLFSSNENSEINLRDMTTTNEGVVRMPTPYGHQSFSSGCTVTIRGLGNSIIIFKQKRLNASNGPCLKNNIINNKIQKGPCHDQKVYFNGLMHLKLEVGEPFQPGFVISFKGESVKQIKGDHIYMNFNSTRKL